MSASFGCPRFGGTEIEEVSEEIAYYPVTEWSQDGEPRMYAGPTYGNSYRADVSYVCVRCHDFSEPTRLSPEVDRG